MEIIRIGTTEIGPVIARLGETIMVRASAICCSAVLSWRGSMDQKVRISRSIFSMEATRMLPRFSLASIEGMLTRFGYLGRTTCLVGFSQTAERSRALPSDMCSSTCSRPCAPDPAFADSVQSCMKCSGFIIDLRGNPGGLGAMAMGMAGWFIDQPNQRLGTLYCATAHLSSWSTLASKRSQTPSQSSWIVQSASTSEIFAGGMKDLKRARVLERELPPLRYRP